jgi:hypothetical protein
VRRAVFPVDPATENDRVESPRAFDSFRGPQGHSGKAESPRPAAWSANKFAGATVALAVLPPVCQHLGFHEIS